MQKGIPVPELMQRFFGEVERYPTEPDGMNLTQAQIRAVCEHISATGDCLWHAQYVVLNWKVCHCAHCMPPVPSVRTTYVPHQPRKVRP